MEEEQTFFNTTRLRVNYVKPPCYVTAEHIASIASGLQYNLQAEKEFSTDSVSTLSYYEQIVQAFNHTAEFWCGPIDVRL